jgi:hypothetical protein
MAQKKKLIEQKAYQFYVERGMQDGFALEDWVKAEKTVLDEEKAKKKAKRIFSH